MGDHEGAHVWSEAYDGDDARTDEAPLTEEFNIVLEAGWNLVSVPLILSDDSRDAVFPPDLSVYTWDAERKSYTSPTHIEAELAYWVSSPEHRSIPLTGVPLPSWNAPAFGGWNMVGSVYSEEPVPLERLIDDPPGAVARNSVFFWEPLLRAYRRADAITSGLGYWLAASESCDMVLLPPES